MYDLVITAINFGGWAVVLAIIYERVKSIEDKINKCIIPRIETTEKSIASIQKDVEYLKNNTKHVIKRL